MNNIYVRQSSGTSLLSLPVLFLSSSLFCTFFPHCLCLPFPFLSRALCLFSLSFSLWQFVASQDNSCYLWCAEIKHSIHAHADNGLSTHKHTCMKLALGSAGCGSNGAVWHPKRISSRCPWAKQPPTAPVASSRDCAYTGRLPVVNVCCSVAAQQSFSGTEKVSGQRKAGAKTPGSQHVGKV